MGKVGDKAKDFGEWYWRTGTFGAFEDGDKGPSAATKRKRLADAKSLQAPDMTDAIVRQALQAETLRQGQGRTRASTFTGTKTLLGG
jgi:hypothetical protein